MARTAACQCGSGGGSLTSGEDEVLERRGAVVGVDDVARLVVDLGNPLGKLARVGDRRRQEHEPHLHT